MLTQLSTVKSRLAILDTDTQYDTLLTNAIKAVSARFDRETNRTLARATAAAEEFPADQIEIAVARYPIESITKFELKTNETDGWVEQTNIQYLIRHACIISLGSPLSTFHSALGRITYAGGYVLPGTTPGPGQTALPDDLEQAAVEQVAAWFQRRDKLALRTSWPASGEYKQFTEPDLLYSVASVLTRYERLSL